MKIEKMKPVDLPEILILAEQLGYPNSLDDLKSRFEEIKDNSDYALFVAKAESNQIIGYIQVNKESHSLLSSSRAEIAALIVDKDVRNKGVGAELLKHAEAWARENNLDIVRLRSNIIRTDAHRFYQRNGYEIVKSWHLFRKGLI
jgi:GNAT superfamily N-acetyltransferase